MRILVPEPGDVPVIGTEEAPSLSPASEQIRLIWAYWPTVALTTIFGLATLLRFQHLGALSLWVDEGLTVLDSHLSWGHVLGLHGAYAAHPPLYFILVKATSLLTGDLLAGRLVSAVAGTLTLPLLYLLVRRLAGQRAALVATLVYALGPLPFWYAREGRPYALVVLLVAASYLALVAVLSQQHRRWLVLYFLSTTLALYTEESAFMALLPQLLILFVMHWRERQHTFALLAVGGTSVALFLPWLPQLLRMAGATSDQSQFALTPTSFFAALRAVVGWDAPQAVFAGGTPPAWEVALPTLHVLLLLSGLAALTGGVVALARHGRLALSVALALGPLVILVTALVSLRVPSFAPRTILTSTLGWALILGAAVTLRQRRWLVWSIRLAVVLTLVASLATDAALATGAYKQDWRTLAHNLEHAAQLGWPVVTYPTVAGTLLGLYQTPSAQSRIYSVDDGGSLPSVSLQGAALWLAYTAGTGETQLQEQLHVSGFERLMHLYVPYPLYLDLYVRHNATVGHALALNSWQVVRAGVAERGHNTGHELPALGDRSGVEQLAYTDHVAQPDQLYLLAARLQATPDQHSTAGGAGRIFLECLAPDQSFLRTAPDDAGLSMPATGHNQQVRLAVLCPRGTTSIRVDLRADGPIKLQIHSLTLSEVAPQPGALARRGTNELAARHS